jgi:hypothetical protein
MVFDFKVLFSIVGVFVDVLNSAIFLEISMNDAIILVEFLFLLFFLEFLNSFDDLFIKRDIEIWKNKLKGTFVILS